MSENTDPEVVEPVETTAAELVSTDSPSETEIAEQKAVRLAKRERLLAEGIDPYPVSLPITHSIPELRVLFPDLEPDATTGVAVCLLYTSPSPRD